MTNWECLHTNQKNRIKKSCFWLSLKNNFLYVLLKGCTYLCSSLDTLCKGRLFKTLLFSVNKHAPKVAKNFKTRSGYLWGFVHLPLGLYDHFEDHTVIASHQDWNREKLTRDYEIYLKNCEAPSSGQKLKIIGSQETNLLYLMAWLDTSQDFLSLQSRHWIAQEFIIA